MLRLALQRALAGRREPVRRDEAPGGGDELDLVAAQAAAYGDPLAVQSGRDRVAVALVADQAARGDDPLDLEHRRIRQTRQRRQPLSGRERGHG